MALHLIMNYPVTAQPPPPHPSPPTADPLHPGIRRAIERILSQLDRDLPLRELAAAAELSPFHFTRLFRRSVGLPPHQFLILKRIERARQLMMGGNLGLAEIALQSGFFDQSHLALHFKRACGMTPRQFINRITQPNASDDSSPDPGSPRVKANPAPRK